jgi:hypothetical protein
MFRINDYLSLRLESRRKSKRKQTMIYINGKPFYQCKFLLLEIPKDSIERGEFEEINSIDDAAEKLNRDLGQIEADELYDELESYFSEEEEFWAHASNLQAWAESGYDTRLLHSNLSFPLLKALSEAGDPQAQAVFHEEIAKRWTDGNQNVKKYLAMEGYIDSLTREESQFLYTDENDYFGIKEIEKERGENLKISLGTNFVGIGCFLGTGHFGLGLKNGLVIALHLGEHRLTHIPEGLRKLKNLEYLKLYFTKVNTIPDWIGELKNLKKLTIREMPVKSIPESIGNLKNLRILDLARNEIESIPDSIGNLSSLKMLNLGGNKLKELPETVGNISSLEVLSIGGNNLQSLPESIQNLRKLKSFSIDDNHFTSIPKYVLDFPYLESLSLSDSMVSSNELKKTLEKKIKDLYIFPIN